MGSGALGPDRDPDLRHHQGHECHRARGRHAFGQPDESGVLLAPEGLQYRSWSFQLAMVGHLPLLRLEQRLRVLDAQERRRCWSPEWYGFTASWGWFEDDMWGEALRYKKEWGENWDVGAGVGYEKTTDERLLIGGGGFAGFRPTFRIGRVRPRSSISRLVSS